MKRTLASGLFWGWIALAGFGCATEVRVNFDPREDFSSYRTWDWLPPGWQVAAAARRVDRGLDAQLRAAIERKLVERGYERAPAGEADFLVTYHLTLERQLVRGVETPAMQTVSSFHREGGYEVTASKPTLQLYEQGTLVLDVADGQERQLVWRGIGIRRVRDSFGIRADDVVSEVFDRFPPEAGSRF